MGIEIADLVARLTREVPEFGEIPDSAGYRDCITSAVADYSGKLPFQRYTTFDIVSGTASYALPADFVSIVVLQTWDQTDDVLVTAAGLVPVAPEYTERFFVEGPNLVFVPTPAYAWTDRGLRYNARHVLDSSDTYALMTAGDVEIFMPLAVALALGLQANFQARNAADQRTQAGSVTKDGVVTALRGRIKDSEKLYAERVADARRKGMTMLRAEYTNAEQAIMLGRVT